MRRVPAREAGAALAMAWLALTGGLLLWSVAPVTWGWQPRLVLSGSMQPDLHPGDVVLTSRLTDAASLGLGQVLAVRAPDLASGSYLHRLVRLEPGGLIVTRGDANPTDDFPAVPVDHVLGQARYVIPLVGRPLLWSRQGNPLPMIGVLLLTALALATLSRPAVGPPGARAGRGSLPGVQLRAGRPARAAASLPEWARNGCAVASVAVMAAGVAAAGPAPEVSARLPSELTTLDRFLPSAASSRPASTSGCLVSWVLPEKLPAGLGYDVLDGSGAVLRSGVTGSSVTLAPPHPGTAFAVRARYGSWTSRLVPVPGPAPQAATTTGAC